MNRLPTPVPLWGRDDVWSRFLCYYKLTTSRLSRRNLGDYLDMRGDPPNGPWWITGSLFTRRVASLTSLPIPFPIGGSMDSSKASSGWGPRVGKGSWHGMYILCSGYALHLRVSTKLTNHTCDPESCPLPIQAFNSFI